MKKRGLFIVTGAVLLCLLLGVYIFLKRQNSTEETAAVDEEDTEEIVSISSDEIKDLVFQMDDGEVTWVKEEEGWKLSEDEEFPVDEDKISTLTSALSSITAQRTLEEVSNLKDYGLETPVNVIKIEKTDGSTESISVGSKNPSTGDTYIYIGENQNTVYTVTNDLASVFSGDLYDFALSEEYPSITGTTIQKIVVDKKENSYTLESDGDSSTGWMVTGEDGDKKEADSTNAGTLQSTAAGLSFSGYYEYDCQDWSLYGLDKPKMELTVDYTEQVIVTDEDETSEDTGDAETKTVSKTLTLYVGSLCEDGNYYVRLEDSQEVHGMSQSSIDSIMNGKAFDYWKLSIDNISIADLDHLDVTYDGQTYTLKRVVTEENADTEDEEGSDDASDDASNDDSDDVSEDVSESESDDSENAATVTTYYADDKEVDSEAFLEFYRGTLSMVCQSRLEEYKEQGEPELTLEYYGTDGSKVTITYTSRDSNFYAVADQDGNYGLVNKMNVKELITKWIQLFNTI